MFGNQLTDEQRKNSLFAGLTMLGIGGAGASLDKYGHRIPKPKMPFSSEYASRMKDKANQALNQVKRQGTRKDAVGCIKST